MVRRISAAALMVLAVAGWNFRDSSLAAGAFRSGQAAASQDQAKGMEAVGQACVQCHNLRPVTLQRRNAERWLETIHDMIGRGAQVKPDEIEPMTVYLAATFGPQVPLRAAPAAQERSQTSAGPEGSLPEGAGRTILTARCVACHGVDSIIAARQSRAQLTETIRRMRVLGAVLTPDEESTVAAYLVEHFGAPAR